MNSQKKIFDLQEANALLPQLETLLGELEDKYEIFRKLQDELLFEEILDEASPAEGKIQELENTLVKLEGEIKKIRSLGCLLRHPQRGLVDFPARKGEEWIYYCWRRGEREIQYYHSSREGFFDRRPIG